MASYTTTKDMTVDGGFGNNSADHSGSTSRGIAADTLARPAEAKHWPLTTRRGRLMMMVAKIVRHGRSPTFKVAKVMVPRTVVQLILRAIAALRRPMPTGC